MQIIDTQDVGSFKIAIVISRYNADLSEEILEAARERLKELEFQDEDVLIVWAPGVLEIPAIAHAIARQKIYAAVVCIGTLIRGETSFYEHACEGLSQTCQTLAVEHQIPVINGILMTETKAQAKERLGGKKGHRVREAINAAYESVSVMRQLGGSK